MTIKMKGITKGFKCISRMFAPKDREIEIGNPTDVKHVAHIGFDGPTGNAPPSWMNEFEAAPGFTSNSVHSVLSSQDCPHTDSPKQIKKHKRKKNRSTSSESSSSSSRSSRAARSEAKFVERTKGHTMLEAA